MALSLWFGALPCVAILVSSPKPLPHFFDNSPISPQLAPSGTSSHMSKAKAWSYDYTRSTLVVLFFFFFFTFIWAQAHIKILRLAWRSAGNFWVLSSLLIQNTELAQHGLRSPPAAASQDMVPELLQQPGKQGRARGRGGPLPQAAAWQSVKKSSLRGLFLVARLLKIFQWERKHFLPI